MTEREPDRERARHDEGRAVARSIARPVALFWSAVVLIGALLAALLR